MASDQNTEISDEYRSAREAYRDARAKQRIRIAAALKAAGFKVKTRGAAGRGLKSYTSGGRLAPAYDLSNWMWVEAELDDNIVIVSLQVLDQDPSSMNIHALLDRIGVEVFQKDNSTAPDDLLFEHATTGFELPLSDSDIQALIAVILDRIAI